MLRLKSVIVLLIMGVMFCFAQKTKNVHEVYTYYPPETMSIADAKVKAVEYAKLQAIANEFGTVVSQHNITRVDNHNGLSNIDFTSYSESDVHGEWIEDRKPAEIKISYEQGMLVVTAEVWGKVREIVSASLNLDIKLLRNGTDDRDEDYNFYDGDDFYMSFTSPINGYLAIYQISDGTAYCLLPYMAQEDGIFKVKANRKYIFFNRNDVDAAKQHLVDEYKMICSSGKTEENFFYVIFSPNSFVKAVDSHATGLPRNLPEDKFQKWLLDCTKADYQMFRKKFPVTISMP